MSSRKLFISIILIIFNYLNCVHTSIQRLPNFKFTKSKKTGWFSRYVIAAMLVDGKQKIAH